jgi:hypothetical protein
MRIVVTTRKKGSDVGVPNNFNLYARTYVFEDTKDLGSTGGIRVWNLSRIFVEPK